MIMTDQLIGKVLADKYQIISLLSENAHGNFYRGTHVSMDKPISIKVLPSALRSDETAVKSFADEARAISRISHPNILNVTDYGSDKDGTIFIVYDDASGETLKDLIIQNGKLSLSRANNIIQQTASALSVAHDNKIVHRNLTSEDILVKQTANGADEVKILNFGSSQIYDASDFDEINSARTVEYFAPEQSDSAKTDARSNVYSLGVILYEMLAGEVPFTADNPTDVLLKHREQMPSPLSAFRKDLPAEVEQVLLTALAKNPDSRYQSASDFADALNAATSTSVGQPLNAPVGIVAAKEPAQNNIWKTAFIVLAGVSLLSVFFIYATQTKQTDPTTQLVTDANGIPVQPVNPATGTTEQSLSNMNTFNPEMFSNTNGAMMQMPPGTAPVAPGGDGYDPWANGGKPPAGAPPTYVGPGGQQVYVDGNGSIFMPSDGNSYIMVPKNANTAANANTRVKNSNTNTNTANTSVKPPANTATNTATPQTKPSPAPITKPSPAKPTPTPKKAATPSATGNRPPSGTTQDLD